MFFLLSHGKSVCEDGVSLVLYQNLNQMNLLKRLVWNYWKEI